MANGTSWSDVVAQANAAALQWYQILADRPVAPLPTGQTLGGSVTVTPRGAAVTVSPALVIVGAVVVIGVIFLVGK